MSKYEFLLVFPEGDSMTIDTERTLQFLLYHPSAIRAEFICISPVDDTIVPEMIILKSNNTLTDDFHKLVRKFWSASGRIYSEGTIQGDINTFKAGWLVSGDEIPTMSGDTLVVIRDDVDREVSGLNIYNTVVPPSIVPNE